MAGRVIGQAVSLGGCAGLANAGDQRRFHFADLVTPDLPASTNSKRMPRNDPSSRHFQDLAALNIEVLGNGIRIDKMLLCGYCTL